MSFQHLHSTQKKSLEQIGHALIMIVALLTTIGLVMVYAASAMKGVQQFGDAFLFFRKQALVGLAGIVGIYIIGKLSENQIRLITMPLLIATIFLLSLIFVPGVYVKSGGASRWLNIAGIRFQTSELAKLALVFFLSKNLSRPDFSIHSFTKGILPNLLVFGLFAMFMMLQSDFGSTVLMGVVMVAMLFIAGLNTRYIIACGAGAITLAVAAIAVAPYRLARLTSFLDPWAEIKRGGFQIIQSYLAFQNGGFAGVGLGESRQKLFFLPEAHTDFILAVLGEEFGFLGIALLICLFAAFVFCGVKIALAQKNLFRKNLAFGLTAIVGIQASINMGVAMGLLPTKGIPLPFISSGASSLLVSLTVTGFLWRLSKDDHAIANPKSVKNPAGAT